MSDRPENRSEQSKQSVFNKQSIFNNTSVGGDVNLHGDIKQFIGKPLERSQEQQHFLNIIKGEVRERLAKSLIKADSPLNLSKESRPDMVNPKSGDGVHTVNSAIVIRSDMTIAEVFDMEVINGKILILGGIGSGKTTTLLQLAWALVEKAEDDLSASIPVLFNLSRWINDGRSIQEWMAKELELKYQSAPELWQSWLTKGFLLPLFDGLDEVAQGRQEKCIQRLNEFLDKETPAVVCSRIEGYKKFLQLNGAVSLKELTDYQIRKYLTDLDRPELWQFLARNSKLLSFVRTPLFLKMTVLAYPQSSVEQWQQLQEAQDQVQYLLDDYVGQMLDLRVKSRAYGANKPPNRQQTLDWLTWLAKKMQQTSQTEFLIEEIQPSMLSSGQKVTYRLLLTSSLALLLGGIGWYVNPNFGHVGGIFLAVCAGFKPELDSKFDSVEALQWSLERYVKKGLPVGLFAGLIIGLLVGLSTSLLVGLSAGLLIGLLLGLPGGLLGTSIDDKDIPNQGIKRSATNFGISIVLGSVVGILALGLIGVLIQSENLSGWLGSGLRSGLLLGLLLGYMNFGGLACVQHFVLRLLLHKSNRIPWNYAQFLDYCTERSLLQRIGGRYSFIHDLLRNYFAEMAKNSRR